MRWLVLAFVVVPLGELYLLLAVGRWIGFWPTVAITLVTAIAGGSLAKREGLRVWDAWRRALERGEPPSQGVLDGVLVLLGGALLITPGIVTDAVGFTLLLPWSRAKVAGALRRHLERRIASGSVQVFTLGGDVQPQSPNATPYDRDLHVGGGVVETRGEAIDSD